MCMHNGYFEIKAPFLRRDEDGPDEYKAYRVSQPLRLGPVTDRWAGNEDERGKRGDSYLTRIPSGGCGRQMLQLIEREATMANSSPSASSAPVVMLSIAKLG